jgi:hypothetical protein
LSNIKSTSPRDQALQRGCRPPVGDVAQLHLGHQLEQLGREMRGRSIALRGGRDLIGIPLQVFDQLGHARCLKVARIDDQRVRHVGHHDNRLEPGRVEPELLIEVLIDHKRRRRRREQCVAIGRRTIGHLGTDVSSRAGAILDDDRLAPLARQPIRDQPRDGIGRSTGGERHDDLHGTIRIVLGVRRTLNGRGQNKPQRQRGQVSADEDQRR